MRLDINLATHPYEDAKEFWQRWGTGLVVMGVVTLFLIGLTVWKWHKAANDRAEVGALEHNIAVLDGKLARNEATLNRAENRTLREQSNYLNNLFQQKAFSWTQVFEDLERVMPAGVHVVSIHPELDTTNQLEIKLTVAGDSSDHALNLVRKMEDSKHFQQIHITDQTFTQTGGDNVKFDIVAFYISDTAFVRQGAAR